MSATVLPSTPAHQFDNADAVWHIGGSFHFRTLNSFLRLLDGGQETKGSVDQANIVVDRLGNATDRAIPLCFDAVL